MTYTTGRRTRITVPYRKGHYFRFDTAVARQVARELHVVAMATTKDFAKKEARLLQRKIEGQRFASFKRFPLAASTLERKKALGRSMRVMMSTRRYIRSIKVMERPAPNGGRTYHIGFDRRRLALDTVTGKPRRALTLNRVALMHEFGGRNAPYPARPLWGPQFALVNMRAFALRDRLRSLAVERARRIMGTL